MPSSRTLLRLAMKRALAAEGKSTASMMGAGTRPMLRKLKRARVDMLDQGEAADIPDFDEYASLGGLGGTAREAERNIVDAAKKRAGLARINDAIDKLDSRFAYRGKRARIGDGKRARFFRGS